MRVNTHPIEDYYKSVVPDAGTGMLHEQRYGHPGEVYPCPRHSGNDCSMCGGAGYRSVCNLTDCHEHGCEGRGCSSTKEQFESQQRSAVRVAKGGRHG